MSSTFEQLALAQEDFVDQFRRSFYKSLLILKYYYVGSHLGIGKVSENSTSHLDKPEIRIFLE